MKTFRFQYKRIITQTLTSTVIMQSLSCVSEENIEYIEYISVHGKTLHVVIQRSDEISFFKMSLDKVM